MLSTKSPSFKPIVHALIWLSALAILFADTRVPLGTALWVFYFIPVSLTLLLESTTLPLLAWAACTILLALGFFLAPSASIAPELSAFNRSCKSTSLLVIALIVRRVIINRSTLAHQAWIQAGRTRLAAKLHGEQSAEQLSQVILATLAPYVGAQVAKIFVFDGHQSYVEVAGYAANSSVDREPRSFKRGEGLVGQAAAEGKLLELDDLPEGYLTISSGLGSMRPRHVLAAPMEADTIVKAVIELGFARKVPDGARELLAQISENVGMALRSAKYRKRLESLLAESQRLTEELQAQQEELRVANEELEEQSKALKESQARLEAQQAELEQSNQQLEEQASILENQKTSLEETQRRLQEKARDLAAASQYKSEFLANMSHELRTPLNSSLILAKLLAENKDRNLTPEQVQFAESIYYSGNDLLNLINDILDLAKVEAGKLEIRPETVRIAALVRSAERTFEPIAREKKLRFRVEAAAGAPDAIVSDEKRVEQILKNFLSNAFKFTNEGEVALRIARDERPGFVAISVTDTGIGIPAEQQGLVFEAFRQADGTTNRKYGGTGLGLSISRDLARLLGGEIRLRSEPGKGSAFTLVLPERFDVAAVAPFEPRRYADVPIARGESAATPSRPRAPAEPVAALHDDRDSIRPSDRKLLIVEDEPQFARILMDLGRELGFKCLVAHKAGDGIALAREYLPHAILLDMVLPDQSGLTVLDRIKLDSATRHIPVHVISSADYTHAAMQLGAVGYLVKPVKREELKTALSHLEERIDREIKRVLIVEDDATQLAAIGKLIEGQDVESVPVRTARDALAQLKHSKFDCMIIDLSLPDMSGYELLEAVAADDSYAHPPVIVYTGRDLARDEEDRLRRFSRTIIIKGAKSPERLLDEVSLFIHRVESAMPEDKQRMLAEVRSRDKALADKRVLLVDDDVRNIFALSNVLEQRGAKVVIARNGRESLARLEDDPEIDLVLMDIMMPEMDGYEAMREIRKQKRFAKLPIIAVTAKAMRDDYERCLQAGANDYLSKPVDVDRLLSLVRVWLAQAGRL